MRYIRVSLMSSSTPSCDFVRLSPQSSLFYFVSSKAKASVELGYNTYGYIGFSDISDTLFGCDGQILLKHRHFYRVSDISYETSNPERSGIFEIYCIYTTYGNCCWHERRPSIRNRRRVDSCLWGQNEMRIFFKNG